MRVEANLHVYTEQCIGTLNSSSVFTPAPVTQRAAPAFQLRSEPARSSSPCWRRLPDTMQAACAALELSADKLVLIHIQSL